MSSKEFMACVVGLSCEMGEPFNWKPGVGKSCLCHRFTHPGLDDYISSHPPVLALHEFESHVINSDHFLYWGSPEVNFSTTDSQKSIALKVHIVEQTVFYQDVTSQPFNVPTKPDNSEAYNRRITGPIESPGKLSYQSRDDIVSPGDYNAALYPSGISKLNRGFIVVVDVSQKGIAFEQQLNRLEKLLDYLTKHKRKLVIAATKRDKAFGPSLDKVYDLKKKYKTTMVEVSADQNHNVKECFRVLAHKVLNRSKLSSHVQTYPEAAHVSLFCKGSAKRSFGSFIKKRINDPDERVHAIEMNEEYKDCVLVIGKYETDKLFAEHVLKVYNEKVDLYAGVKDNPEMREEFLEDFVAQREDLALYTKELREWIEAHMRELDEDEDEDEDDLPTPLTPPHIDDYQLFQRSSSHPNPPSPMPSKHGPMTTPLDTEDNDDSYYSDSDGSEGPDYVNYDPNNPSMCLDTQDVSPIQNTPLLNTSTGPPPRQSVKNQANVLASLLGHKSIPPQTVSHNSVQALTTTPAMPTSFQLTRTTVPPRDMKSPPPPATPREVKISPEPPHEVKSLPSPAHTREVKISPAHTRDMKSPPPPAHTRDMKSPPPVSIKPTVKPYTTGPNSLLTTIKSRAQTLSAQLGHIQLESSSSAPPPPATKPKPSRSPAVQQQLNLSDNADLSKLQKSKSSSFEGENGIRTPPPIATRVSSLLRNSSLTDSDQDSAPNTPRLTRRPSRVAPPPPVRNPSPPVPVRAAPPPPMQPSSELTTSKPLLPPPPSIDVASEVDSVPKRRLDQIRKQIIERKTCETHQLVDKSETIVHENIATQLKEPLDEKIRRESYQKSRIKSASVDPICSTTPPVVQKKYTKHVLKSSHSEDTGPPSPLPKYLAIVNVDQPTIVSPPPPLPPRPMEVSDNDGAPQLPPRTEEMMVIEEDVRSKPKGRKRNYTNVVAVTTDAADSNTTSPNILKRILGRKRKEKSPSTDSEPLVTSPTHIISPSRKTMPLPPPPSRELPPIPTTPQAQFMVMKNRPLPQEPLFPKADDYDDDESHEYEMFDFNDERRPIHVKPRLSLDSSAVNSTKGNKEQWSIQPKPKDPPNQRVDVTQSLNIASIKKSKTFNGNDRSRMAAAPKRFNDPQRVWPMYVDGYVNTDHPPPGFVVPQSPSASIQSRQLPLTPFEQLAGTDQASETQETLDYDYPFFRTLPLPGKKKPSWGAPIPTMGSVVPMPTMGSLVPMPTMGSQIPVPPRFPPTRTQDPDDEDADDYIHMQNQYGSNDGSYVNSDSLDQILAQIQPGNIPAVNPLNQYSHDDMYMNLPGNNHSVSLPLMQHGAPTLTPSFKVPPRRRSEAATSVVPTPLVEEQQPSWPTTLEPPAKESALEDSQLYVNLNDSLLPSENILEGDGQVYMNVNDSLSSSLFQQIDRLASPPRSKQPVNAPTISLPPRNIKRATRDNSS